DDLKSPPPSPLSPYLFAAYQKMIAEADLTKRERALITVLPYGTKDVKPRVEIDQWETLLEDPIDELITRFRQVCEDAEIHARDAQEEAQERRLEALEKVVQQIRRNNY
ncbi:hypothetical protein Tco_0253753, partial [Tanacetum coccineum]